METLESIYGYCERLQKGTLYCFQCKALLGRFLAIAEFDSHLELWHKRFGHMSQKGLEVLSILKRLDVKGSNLIFCNDCLFRKQVRNYYYYSNVNKFLVSSLEVPIKRSIKKIAKVRTPNKPPNIPHN